ncbi:hypothetical protein AaE_006481 [Aphanomyces astaci]|uniref:Uncharacterized protein n=2 Tax=Aphanomyces astaci TaxID=112090 RepID=A0A6A5ADA1_APHAT|nr:hypothetical protein AaE_006481 [Aphanomyces astaci]
MATSPVTTASASSPNIATSMSHMNEGEGPWTRSEHERFLAATKLFPLGPWKVIAAHVRTRNVRQTQTHAQKYKEKLARWDRGLSRRRKISFESEDGRRPNYIERPTDKAVKRKKAKHRSTKKALRRKKAATLSPEEPSELTKADEPDDLEPLAFSTQDCFKLLAMMDASPSPCQVDALPSLGESLDYFMEMFET